MNKLVEIFLRYQLLLFFLVIMLVGVGAYTLGNMTASSNANMVQGNGPSSSVSTSDKTTATTKSEKTNNEPVPRTQEEADAKAEQVLNQIDNQLKERNKKIEEDESVGTVKNGTVNFGAPKFDIEVNPSTEIDHVGN